MATVLAILEIDWALKPNIISKSLSLFGYASLLRSIHNPSTPRNKNDTNCNIYQVNVSQNFNTKVKQLPEVIFLVLVVISAGNLNA